MKTIALILIGLMLGVFLKGAYQGYAEDARAIKSVENRKHRSEITRAFWAGAEWALDKRISTADLAIDRIMPDEWRE